MRKATSHKPKSAIITVGELISELCRWPDHDAVTFRCPVQNQELLFYRVGRKSGGGVEIELDPAPQNAPVVLA